MGDVASGDACDRQPRVENEQGGGAKRARADRGQRHQHSEQSAEQHGPAVDPRFGKMVETRPRPFEDPRPEENRERGHQQRNAKQDVEDAWPLGAGRSPVVHREQGDDCGWNAAQREAGDDMPVDRLARSVDRGADGLGNRRIEQIGADRGRRVETEQQDQQRGHQRSAANPRQSNQYPDEQPGQRIHGIECSDDPGPR